MRVALMGLLFIITAQAGYALEACSIEKINLPKNETFDLANLYTRMNDGLSIVYHDKEHLIALEKVMLANRSRLNRVQVAKFDYAKRQIFLILKRAALVNGVGILEVSDKADLSFEVKRFGEAAACGHVSILRGEVLVGPEEFRDALGARVNGDFKLYARRCHHEIPVGMGGGNRISAISAGESIRLQ